MKNPRFRKPIAVYHILSEKARVFFKKVKIFVQCRKRCESETGKEVCNNRKRLWRIHKEYTLFRSAEPFDQSLFFPFSSIFNESTQKRRPFLLGKSFESKNPLLHIHGFQRVHPVIHRNILPHFRKDLPVFFGNYIVLKAVKLSCVALAFVRLIQKRQ